MDEITTQLRLGSKYDYYTGIGRCHDILHDALRTLAGIQQHPACTEPRENHDQYEEDMISAEMSLERIAKELYIGLTGRKPWFKKEDTVKTKRKAHHQNTFDIAKKTAKCLRKKKVVLTAETDEDTCEVTGAVNLYVTMMN